MASVWRKQNRLGWWFKRVFFFFFLTHETLSSNKVFRREVQHLKETNNRAALVKALCKPFPTHFCRAQESNTENPGLDHFLNSLWALHSHFITPATPGTSKLVTIESLRAANHIFTRFPLELPHLKTFFRKNFSYCMFEWWNQTWLLLLCGQVTTEWIKSLVFQLLMSSELNSLKLFCQVLLRCIEISTHTGYTYLES